MFGANLFFKKPENHFMDMRTREYTQADAQRDRERRIQRESQPTIHRGGNSYHNNDSVKPVIGHSKFGYNTMLNKDTFGKLPTAPAIVGGNVDWTNSKVTPATHMLHDTLKTVRPMNPPPALGSALRLMEPNVNSIHTTY